MHAVASPAPGQPRPSRPDTRRGMRARRGRRSYHAGESAEAQVARLYGRMGAELRESRYRTQEGEIDLVLEIDGLTVFVEVKQSRSTWNAEQPVSKRQQNRIGAAAMAYLSEQFTRLGGNMACRFDVALVGPGGEIRLIENALSFDSF